MIRTRVGYTGGSTVNPTYRSLGDHTETIQMDYDPAKVSYDELLEVFWDSHNPSARSWSRQYASVIFYHDEGQRLLVEESRRRAEAKLGAPILTDIVPMPVFYRAEDYHQKYYLRHEPDLMQRLGVAYPDARAFTDSTAAARLNGYAGGYGTSDGLEEAQEELGLSATGAGRLAKLADRGLKDGCAVPRG